MNNERDEFIKDNLNLVHSCCHRFKNKGIDYDDLYSAGCIGLIKAYDKFDKSLGFAFSTYAVPVILGEIKRLFREDGTVKIGRRMKDLSRNVEKTRESLAKEFSREPTVSEIADRMNISVEQVTDAICAAQPTLSLDYTDSDGNEVCIASVEDKSEQIIGSLALKQTLAALENRDRAIIFERYFNNQTQSSTAKKLGMTQVQVSRREKVILQKLRAELT